MSSDRLRNIMYAYKGKHHSGGHAKVAEDIARQAAKEALGPLLDAACIRLSYILKRLYDIAADRASTSSECRPQAWLKVVARQGMPLRILDMRRFLGHAEA